MIDFSVFKHQSDNPYFTFNVETSKDYKVFIGEKEVPVYTCRISRYPFNTWWPGHQRVATQTEVVSYVNLVSDEDVPLSVIPTKKDYDKIIIKPYSKNVQVQKSGDTINFTLKEHGGYVLELGDYHGCLYVFNSKPVTCENPDDATYYFGPGVHFPRRIELKSNESVYIDKDALVFGHVFANNVKNVKVYGNGVIDDALEERPFEHCTSVITNGCLKFMHCNSVLVEGVSLLNSACWVFCLFNCENVVIDDVKIFGQWRYNTDGIDVLNCKNLEIKNSFIHSFDDSIVLKGYDEYSDKSNENIYVHNCVVWCDWGRALEIGFETSCREYKNIHFEDVDIVRAGGIAMDIQNGDCAEVHNVTYENIRVEYESFYTPEVYQATEDQVYDKQDDIISTYLFTIINPGFRDAYNKVLTNNPLGPARYKLEEGDPRFRSVRDITVKNIQIYADQKVIDTLKEKTIKFLFNNTLKEASYANIKIEDVYINRKKLSYEDTFIEIKNEGTIKDVFVLGKKL